MKHKLYKHITRITAIFLAFILCFADVVPVLADTQKEKEEIAEEDVVSISTVEEFLNFVDECKVDIYSVGKVVELTTDLDLSGVDFSGIAYFNGTFQGNGHIINGLKIQDKGSHLGFFRYIGELGIVSDLKVYGTVTPEGTQTEIGGIAGVNYGVIKNSSFSGSICGIESVGAIVGLNKSSGQVLNCNSNAVVVATDNTGGIVGVNEGIVDGCTSRSQINIDELETVLDLGGIDIGTMNLTQNVVNRNNMGGIAGSSTGIIRDCKNYGIIGFAHTGYNVGGIAGTQSGVIIGCQNEGKVLGRKDVGGIVGQAEPYIASEYLSEQIDQTESDLKRMERTLNGLSSSIEKTSADTEKYMSALNAQTESIKNRTEQLSNSVSQNNQNTQQYTENINQAMSRIEEIKNKDGELTQEDIDEIQKNMDIVNENMQKIQNSSSSSTGAMQDYASELTNELKSGETQENLDGLTNTIKSGASEISNSIEKLSAQMETLTGHLEDYTATLRGEEDIIVDISSIKTAAELDGVISECINHGTVEGDLNVGGIAGTMNIEYGDDPEENLSISEDVDVAVRSEINDVLISCENYGKVNGKKNYIGSVVGLQEFGFVYECEGYGPVKVSAGNYVGGIAGASNGRIEKCYSMTDLIGIDYIGGIAGEGSIVVDCLSAAKIDSNGEYLGGVLGSLKEDGSITRNYFVKDEYDAVDNISYVGGAEPISYADLAQQEDLPKGFTEVCITYEVEGEVISEEMISYGSSLSEEDFPTLENRDGYYVVWPKEEVYTNICNNLTITAEYVPWMQSIASLEISENGKTLFIAVADFYEETELRLSDVTTAPDLEEGYTLCYAYDWEIVSEEEKVFEVVEGHFFKPDVEGTIQIWYEKDGVWIQASYEEDGSYLVAELPYGAAFSVVEAPADNQALYKTIGAAVLVFLLVILIVIIHNKRRKKVKK